MAYEKLADLSTDTVYKIGGVDSKTGKPNPIEIEGYYLGSRTVPNNNGGTSAIHVFQTPKGNIGAWGTADLNSKLGSVALGTQTLVEYKGKRKLTGGKTKHMYDVSVDKNNTVDVPKLTAGAANDVVEYADDSETDDDTVDSADDVDQNLAAAAAKRQADVQALIKRNKTR